MTASQKHGSFVLEPRGSQSFMLEALESRRLMTVTLDNGVLTITGTDGDDRVIFLKEAGRLNVYEERVGMADKPSWTGTGSGYMGPADLVKSIRVEAGAGDDDIWVMKNSDEAFDIPMFIDGGAGHDVLGGGDASDTIVGGAGDDWIVGDSAANRIWTDLRRYSDYRYNGDIDAKGPAGDYTGAAINNNGAGDLLCADALPPVQPQSQTAPLTKQTANRAPAASADSLVAMPAAVLAPAPFARTLNPLLEGEAAEVWGAAA